MEFKVKKLFEDSLLPVRAHSDDAGLDVFAYNDTIINPGEVVAVKTGFSAALPKGYVSLVWDKSSVASKGIKTLGGVIDAGYRGEYLIVMTNLTQKEYTFKKGNKIAQILIQKVELLDVTEVVELDDTMRGEGGFGSTGSSLTI